MKVNPLYWLAFAAGALSLPDTPPLSFLYSVNLTSGGSHIPGLSPVGNRTAIFHGGGEFAGPKLRGKCRTYVHSHQM